MSKNGGQHQHRTSRSGKEQAKEMEVIQLATPAHFARGRVERIGLHQNSLFVAWRDEQYLEVWTVHCLVPCSWHRLFRQGFHELFYTRCAVSSAQNAVFALVAAFFENENLDGGISIFRFDLTSGQLEEFVLDPEEAPKFEEVTLERVALGCERREGLLFLHDRTMVTGQIPFWRIQLHPDRVFSQMNGADEANERPLKMTFSIRPMPILDEQHICAQCTRFPVLLDGDSRTVMRITNDFQVFVHDGDNECWELLTASEETEFNLSSISVRGISETFGTFGHRFSAIESKLSIFADGDSCIFKVFQTGIHHFFRFTVSLPTKTYNLANCSCAKLDKRLETLCFVHCAEKRMAFVNKHLVGFVPIQPPSLREICFWGLQKQFADRTMGWGTKVWSGGKTAQEIQTMFNINHGLELVD